MPPEKINRVNMRLLPFSVQTVVVKDTLYVCGGWNSVQQFDDLYILDTKTWAWNKADCGSGDAWGPPRWEVVSVWLGENLYQYKVTSMRECLFPWCPNCLSCMHARWPSSGSSRFCLDYNLFGAALCRWNHSAVGVFAVPHWKVFVFGGNSGNLAEGGNPQVCITHWNCFSALSWEHKIGTKNLPNLFRNCIEFFFV